MEDQVHEVVFEVLVVRDRGGGEVDDGLRAGGFAGGGAGVFAGSEGGVGHGGVHVVGHVARRLEVLECFRFIGM
jgi:hypothetical protein